MWEYEIEQLTNYTDGDSYKAKLEEALKDAGKKGWEFVSALRSSENEHARADLLIFKSPTS